jgi:hypothetical protein
LALKGQVLKQSGKSRLTSIAAKSLRGTSRTRSDSATSESAERTISRPLTCSVEDSPAKTFPTPASEQGLTESAADCGASMRESFANYDPATSSWRTSQLCLDGEWSEFSETWPRAGMTRSGRAYELPTLVPHTEENESGFVPTPEASNTKAVALRTNGRPPKNYLWPTPTASEDMAECMKRAENMDGHNKHSLPLSRAVRLWPTPSAREVRNGWQDREGETKGTQESLSTIVMRELGRKTSEPCTGGQLNPTWVEWLMGYPLEWTALEDSATPSSRKSRNGSAKG